MALKRDMIVEAAAQILDAYGLADLSMRRVADALGVQAGALYYHVPNKQSLLSAVADEILDAIGEVDSLDEWARRYRDVLLDWRDGAELVSATRATGLGAVDPTTPARHLVPDERADVVLGTLEHFVLGATLHDQTRFQLASLGVIEEFDEEESEARFTEGLGVILVGVGIFIELVA